ncbi:unnamed protein product [Chondrus crispus]|uniref:S1 motif domain-containing protein n=1 Tax=Chondrus crispus TaxID=2769 RepID=R7Q6B0_CHOCR|nr:unnamed protein product [Chondrus crispus]CDF32975.1 unnamed protein product [Chondrus crispus]|eukprot:XP_005712778.1 unnamed protein product [Chondrus crispus]
MRPDSLRMQSISFVVPSTPASSTHARSRLIGTGIGRMPPRRGPVPRAVGRTRAAVGMTPSAQLNPGDEVEGRVTRLVRYGAFVDLGANGSGLVHISEVTDSFVSDISAHLKEGDVVLVRVLSVDANNGRIALSMRQSTAAIPSGYDRVIELGGDWGHPWNDDGQAQYADLGPRTKGPEAWEPDPDLFRKWDTPKDNDNA